MNYNDIFICKNQNEVNKVDKLIDVKPELLRLLNHPLKWLVFFLTCVQFSSPFAQIRLCEENALMYSTCYELHKDGSFTFEYSDCTGTTIGSGKFTKKRKSLILNFENMKVNPEVTHKFDGAMGSYVSIRVFDLLQKEPDPFVRIVYNEKTYITNIDGHCKLQYTGGAIKILQSNRDTIVITPDKDESNSYEVYNMPIGVSTVEEGRIVELIKTRKKYMLRQKDLFYTDKKGFFPKWRTRYYVEI